MKKVIVTRHWGLVRWLRQKYPHLMSAELVETATAQDVTGHHVYGVLPLHLAALADKVSVVEFKTPVRGGMDLSAEQMDEAGAFLRTFKVTEVK